MYDLYNPQYLADSYSFLYVYYLDIHCICTILYAAFCKIVRYHLFFLQDLYDLLSLNLLQIQNTRLLQLFHIILKILRTNELKLFKSLVLIFLKKLNFN